MFKALIHVTLKAGVLDAQGSAVKNALHSMSYADVTEVRVGKFIELTLQCESREEAQSQTDDICRKLLANPVIEDYRFEVVSIQ